MLPWPGISPGGSVAKLRERIFVNHLDTDTVYDTVVLFDPGNGQAARAGPIDRMGVSRAVRSQTLALDGSRLSLWTPGNGQAL